MCKDSNCCCSDSYTHSKTDSFINTGCKTSDKQLADKIKVLTESFCEDQLVSTPHNISNVTKTSSQKYWGIIIG